MALPDPNLDDLRFQQDLVDEARLRINRYCPEWTDYNVSDPGITLIELFAWMTEQIVYRLNRVPDKNYIKFMDMLGITLQPASPARTELTFRLSAPFPLSPGNQTTAMVPRGTEVATLASDDVPEVIFTTDEELAINPPALTDLRRTDEFHKNYVPRMGIETFYAFNRPPQQGDTFYLGFDPDIDLAGHILRLGFTCDPTQGTGIKREDPPLVWECSLGDGEWLHLPVSRRHDEKDTTGGLNNPEGRLTLYLPLEAKPDQVRGRHAFWLRCRFEQQNPEQGLYSQSPRITSITVQATGAATPATHAMYDYDLFLGQSSGDPGQIFQLDNAPILKLFADEHVLVEELVDGDLVFVPWTHVVDFSASSRFDRHFTVDPASGQVEFGPAVRQPDGSVQQYGRIPEIGREIRFSQYRYGGGIGGNVHAGKIQILRTALPYIDQVENRKPAYGGRDQESLEEAKFRARRELRAQQRAVTAEDFENLALGATRQVVRVKCNAAHQQNRALPSGMVEVLLVPEATESLRIGDRSALRVSQALIDTVRTHLDQYRLLTTTLRIREPDYIGVKIVADIVAHDFHNPDMVRSRVLDTLHAYLNPVPMFLRGEEPSPFIPPEWPGWSFGHDLYRAQIYSLVQGVNGVKHVVEIQMEIRPVIPSEEVMNTPLPDVEADDENLVDELDQDEGLTLVEDRMVPVAADTLICSLNHDVRIVTI